MRHAHRMGGLRAKFLAGQPVTLIDKIDAETCVEELDAMRAALIGREVVLTPAQEQAFARRRVELLRGGR